MAGAADRRDRRRAGPDDREPHRQATTARSITAGGAITLKASGVSAVGAPGECQRVRRSPENSTNGSGTGGRRRRGRRRRPAGAEQRTTPTRPARPTAARPPARRQRPRRVDLGRQGERRRGRRARPRDDEARRRPSRPRSHADHAGGLVTLASSANTDAATAPTARPRTARRRRSAPRSRSPSRTSPTRRILPAGATIMRHTTSPSRRP